MKRSNLAAALRQVASYLIALECASLGGFAQAGRPLDTDDAGTVGAQACQIEAWYETNRTSTSSGTERGKELVLSPACGIGEAFEINVELARSLPTDGTRLHSTLALKWADPSWAQDGLRWGLKAWRGTVHRESDPSWRPGSTGASALVSWEASSVLTVHANLGFERDHVDRHTNRLANLALDWAVTDRLHTFAEALSLHRQPTQFNTGARWWLAAERLALDVTLGHGGGSEPQRRLSIGLGWYGLGW